MGQKHISAGAVGYPAEKEVRYLHVIRALVFKGSSDGARGLKGSVIRGLG